MTDTATPTPESRLKTFRERREASVSAPQGNLALVATQLIDAEQSVWGVPGTWAPADPGESGIRLTAESSEGIRLNGELVDGTVVVAGRDSSEPGELRFSDSLTAFVQPMAGSYALRVWDAESEAVVAFGGIDAFPFAPEWVIEARFSPADDGSTIGIERIKSDGATNEEKYAGDIEFSLGGTEYRLAALASGRALQIVFSDATSGVSSYSMGRFLFAAPKPDGTITLDFNTAIVPPCGFSYAFNCPMPPKQNRFAIPIEAGEKNPVKRDGSLLHG